MTQTFIQQVELSNDMTFIKRVRQAIVKAAIAISAEAASGKPTLDTARLNYSTLVLRDPDRFARIMACGVATADAVTEKSTDADLYNVIAGQWNAYAGAKPS
jgi:hypothetical protein